MEEDEEIIWLEDDSPHDQLAMAIYSELHFQRYSEYISFAQKLLDDGILEKFVNGIKLIFEIKNRKLNTSYCLPDGQEFQSSKEINWRPLILENQVDQQLLLLITEAETNALLYEPGKEFQLYCLPAVGFAKPVENNIRYTIDLIRWKFRDKFRLLRWTR